MESRREECFFCSSSRVFRQAFVYPWKPIQGTGGAQGPLGGAVTLQFPRLCLDQAHIYLPWGLSCPSDSGLPGLSKEDRLS